MAKGMKKNELADGGRNTILTVAGRYMEAELYRGNYLVSRVKN